MTAPTIDADADQQAKFVALVERLSRQSIDKHFDAYVDVAWDDPALAIDASDPRWELPADSPLGATGWYRKLPPATRSQIGLHLTVSNMKAGLQFESVLKRGLLEYAFKLPDNRPEFRYVYHEVIEEAQHSLMFQEFVNRSGLRAQGLSWDLKIGTRGVISTARWFPTLFFVYVLGGEDPIDHVQREALRSGRDLHPLVERIMRIHVTEEARHLSFARQYLRREVPRLGPIRRAVLAFEAPLILAVMAKVMMRPSKAIVKEYRIPRSVLREAYGRGTASRIEVRRSLRKVRRLIVELGLVNPLTKKLWQLAGIWDED